MKCHLKNILIWSCFLFSVKIHAQSNFYDINAIQKIELFTSSNNWDAKMDTLKATTESYFLMDSIKVNGIKFDSIGVKYKGNSSYNSNFIKNPFHIALDEFKNQSYKGYTDIKLGNGYADPSLLREVLSYDILKKYMNCPNSNFAMLYINNIYIGLFSNSENIDKKFCADRFYSSSNPFFKCNPIVSPGTSSRCNLKFITSDSSSYFNYYEMKSKVGWNDFVKLCDTITNYPTNISSAIDLDRVLWMLSFNNVLVNLDSYNGAFVQNYYLYKDNTNHYNPIIWDLNMSFGGFNFAGSQGGGGFNPLSISGMQQLSPMHHLTDADWPLIQNTLSDASTKRKYIAHLKILLDENFSNNNYISRFNQFKNLIDTAVQKDTNKFYSYNLFQNALDSTLPTGSKTPGIRSLMNARTTYIQSLADYSAVAPIIINKNVSNNAPAYNSNVSFTLNVTGASEVFLGYRYDITKKFTLVKMFDDGMHGDGSAGDNTFGVDIKMSNGSIQYYFYAENNDAGIFSPVRAEHEFYNLYVNNNQPSNGEIVINEFLTNNTIGERDEYNEREDWIELYNNSNKLLDLSNLYFSDDLSNLKKWKFPANTSIAPNQYMIVWADDDSTQKIFHTNFNLSKDSGLITLSNESGIVLQQVKYGSQIADMSYSRYPNAVGDFRVQNPTFKSSNGISSIIELQDEISLYPNPIIDFLNIKLNEKAVKIQIVDLLGSIVLENNSIDELININLINLNAGVYILNIISQSNNSIGKRIIKL